MNSWTASEWAAVGSVGAVVVYVVLGWIAIRQLGESRRLRELEYRPYVLVDFYFKGFFVMLEVRNIGKNPARDVTITFDKPLVPSDDRRSANFSIFDAPIPMVAPSRIIRLPMGSGPAFFKEGQEAPLSYKVNISYTDMTGQVVYNDPPLLLDLMPYKHTSPPRDDAADLVSGIRDIRRILDKWGSHRGLNVVATDSFKAARAERREDAFYDGRRALRADGARGFWEFTKQRIKHRLR